MELSKSFSFFDPSKVGNCHIIGCGSVGSTVADLLSRFGINNIYLYDFDEVEAHNIVNQMFTYEDVGKNKAEAVAEHVKKVNPDIENVKVFNEGYTNQNLNDYVFLCVDSIELRRSIVEALTMKVGVKAIFDFRTRLTDAQHYAADWNNLKQRKALINSMNFSHEEAMAETPQSACGLTLGVAPTVRMICNVGVANFVNFVKSGCLEPTINIDAFDFIISKY